MYHFNKVSPELFLNKLEFAQSNRKVVMEATTPVKGITDHHGVTYYLASSNDFRGRKYPCSMGYAIGMTGELTSVWSMFKGHGANLMLSALANGARHLGCFDGYLTTFYNRFGFKETSREANWTPGEPDIVYMTFNL